MTSTLFQQFISFFKEIDPNSDFNDINTYDVLVDELYVEVQNNLKPFALRFDQLLNLYYQLLQNYQAESTSLTVCSNLFEVFVILAERRPTLIKKNMTRLLNMVQKLYEMFNLVDFKYDEHWIKPYEGYNDQNDFSEDNTLTKQIMSYFDRIANTFTYPKFIQVFLSILPTWWESSENNWKSRYCLVMIMSQFGENVEFPLTIKNFIQCGKQSATHQHPKVRYAALQMFGQLADDMKPGFQQVYGEELLPAIIGCTKDQIPRVQGHAMACLTNFLQDFQHQDYHILSPYVDEIINVSQNFSYNGCSILKENTISTLASLSCCELLTSHHVQKILGIINHLLMLQQHQKPEYNQLINQTLECLSMVLYGQPDKVQNVLSQSINIMKNMKTRISATYLVNAWSRICLKYQNFTELSDIFPYILQQITSMIQNYESELQSSISSVQNTITSFKGHIKPYATSIIQFCKNGLLKLTQDPDLKSIMYSILDELIVTLKNEAPDPQWDAVSKEIFTYLYNEVEKLLNQPNTDEAEYTSLEHALGGLQRCIPYVNNLITSENSTSFSQSIFMFGLKINEIIKQMRQSISNDKVNSQNAEDQLDQQDYNQLIEAQEQQLKRLYKSRLIIPDIFEQILKIVSNQNAKLIVQSLYPFVSNYLQNDLPFQDIRLGLYFLVDFLGALKYEGIQEHATVYESKFCQFCLSPNAEVRNCAVFGLGEFMKLIPAQKTDQNMIYKWLNLLWNSLSISFEENHDKGLFNFARDNIVSALGKLIESKRSYYPVALNQQVHKKWFQNLPLNYDKIQGNIQHQILLNLLEQAPETFIEQKEDILQLLKIFAKYFSKRMLKTEELVLKNKKMTKQYLFKMKDWPIFQLNSDFLWNNLPSNQKEILTQLMSAP